MKYKSHVTANHSHVMANQFPHQKTTKQCSTECVVCNHRPLKHVALTYSDVMKLVKIRIRRIRISTFEIR